MSLNFKDMPSSHEIANRAGFSEAVRPYALELRSARSNGIPG